MRLPVRSGRLKAIALEMGEPIETLIPRMVEEEGTAMGAAMRLGVTVNTVRYWLLKLGYEARPKHAIVWEKVEEGES